MKNLIAIIAVTSILTISAAAQELPYQERYENQMGTEAPHKKDLTDATSNAKDGAVYANRHVSEFAAMAWNFAPSPNPLIFDEQVRPLNEADKQHLESTNADGYIVVKDGTIIHEYYAKGMHPTTKHAVYSAGKSWASATWYKVLVPVMDKTVGELMPELKGSIYENQTVRDVVDMRVPVYWYEDFDDPNSPVMLSGAATGYDYKNVEIDQIEFLKSLKRNPELEDGDWYYSSANTLVLGLLGAKLQNVHAYEGINQFYNDLGLEHISGTVANLHGQVSNDGGQYFTLRDFVKLPYAMANNGVVNGKTVFTEAYFNDIFTTNSAKTKAYKESDFGKAVSMVNNTSNKWYIIDNDIAFGFGSYGQFMIFNRKTNVAIAKFSTYKIGQDFEMAIEDINWLIEQVKQY